MTDYRGMGARALLVAALASLAVLAVVSGSSGRALANPWTGTWDTEWGVMTLTQSGSQVTGTYPHDTGHIAGTVTGNLLKGRWTELPTRKGPSDAGAVELTMSADGKTLTGRWNYAGSPTSWNTNWNGTRVASAGGGGSSPPPTGTPTGTVTVNGAPYVSGAIPYGSTVDVTNGTLVLKADVGTLKVTGAGGVSAAFKLVRGKDGTKPVVELRLVKGDFSVCPKRTTSAIGAKASPVVRQIWGNGKGKFRTQGKYASATVRGTNWLTADRCDGTQVKVVRGVIQVSDFPKQKTVTVAAGRNYLASP
jgi:hypothetical protein